MKPFKVDRLAMHQTWYDNNKKLLSLEAHGVMQELLAMCRERTAERDEAVREVRALQKKIGDTSTMLYDWDGYYNPHSQSGNIVEMAKLVEEAYSALQGRSWNEEKA